MTTCVIEENELLEALSGARLKKKVFKWLSASHISNMTRPNEM